MLASSQSASLTLLQTESEIRSEELRGVVSGITSSFTLGLALDNKSRGGSSFMHNHLTLGTLI